MNAERDCLTSNLHRLQRFLANLLNLYTWTSMDMDALFQRMGRYELVNWVYIAWCAKRGPTPNLGLIIRSETTLLCNDSDMPIDPKWSQLIPTSQLIICDPR